jgi:hypothetical protein
MTPVKRAPRFDIREASGIILLVAAALLVANVAATVLLVRPRVTRYHQLTDTSSPQAQLVKMREAEVVGKETHRQALEKAKADMTHLAADVLSTRQKRMIDVQLEISELLKEFGLTWDRVQYENEPLEGNDALERFAIVVPLEGGYSSLRKFIQAVEKSENFLVIERVQLGTGKVQDVVELNLTLATYFITPDAKLENLGKKAAGPAKES